MGNSMNHKKPRRGESLAESNPELARQWHLTKNGKLTSYDVTPGSSKKVRWKCPKGDDHEWQVSVSNRKAGWGCPVCSGRKVAKSNCLATLNPELAKDYTVGGGYLTGF